MYFYRILIAIAFIVQSPSSLADSLQNIDHIIIIYGENRSFDNLYGMFPGADGVMDLKSIQYQQVDNDWQSIQIPTSSLEEEQKD